MKYDKYAIIKGPLITEKSTDMKEFNRVVGFIVDLKANKIQIKQAVERLYGKKVESVNTANFAGKLRRQRTALAGRSNHWKKAVVTLKKGETIELV